MRVIVDLELCQGHAQCEDAAPEIFEVGDDALVHLRLETVPEELHGKVADAVQRCPAAALQIRED